MDAIDKRTEEKISNILKWAYEDGIQYSETIDYITGAKNISNANKLSRLLFANGLTKQMINDFIKRNDYDISTLIEDDERESSTFEKTEVEELDEESKAEETVEEPIEENESGSNETVPFAVQEWIEIIEEGLKDMENKTEQEVDKNEILKKSDERLMKQIVHAIKSLQDKGIEEFDIDAYLNGNATVGIDNKEIDRILYIHRLTKQMVNNYMRRNDYDIMKLVEEFENKEIEFTRLDVEKIKKEKTKTTVKEQKVETKAKEEPKVEEEPTKGETIEEDLDLENVEFEDLEVPKYEEKIEFEDLEVPEYEAEGDEHEEEHEDEEELDEDNIQPELTEKAKALLAKAEMLTAKVEEEKNPIKRHILAFRIKQTLKKVQKEIDLQNIRSKYELKKKQLKTKKEKRELESEDRIAETTAEIKQLKKELKGNEEYDYKSKNFMYPREHVEKNGGLEAFSKKLQESKKAETQNAGQKIELMVAKRKELEKLQDKLNTYKEELKNSDANYNKKLSGLEFKQKSLIVAEKANIFTWIRSTFSNITSQVKTYFEERRENKELQAEQMKEEQELEDSYRKQIEELREQLEKAKKEMKEKNEANNQSKTEQKGKDMAASFREQMSDMKNYSQIPEEQEHEEASDENKREDEQEQEDEQEL